MATIQSSIKLTDGMTPALQSMNKALNIVLNSFESMQRVSGRAVDTKSIQTARAELSKAQVQFNNIENEIRQNTAAQNNFNNSVHNGSNAAHNLWNKLKSIAGIYLGFQSVKGIFGLSDELTNTTARLNMINDGLQTTEELNQKIYESAMRSRGSFLDTADAVAKLGLRAGDIFKNNDETIAFAETLNKMFVVAGASQQEMASATLQLTQALGSGVLRGEEFNAVFEAAPNIMKAVADYMGLPIGQLRNMAAEGKISTEIVKNALFAAAEDVNKQFESMPVTWAQMWTIIKNYTLKVTRPILDTISKITSSERFINFANTVGSALNIMAQVLGAVFDLALKTFSVFYDNWSLISPVVWTVVAALVAYYGMLLIVRFVEWASVAAKYALAFATAVVAIAKWAFTGATWAEVKATLAATGAQWGLNAALYSCPIFWIIMAIIAVIAVIYIAVAAINRFAGTSISATGIVAGAFMYLYATVYNLIAYMWNMWASFIEFFVNVVKNPIYSVKKLFVDLAINVLDACIAMTKGWDDFATSFANAIIKAVNWAIEAWNKFIDFLPDSVTSFLHLGKGETISERKSITSDLTNAKSKLESLVADKPADYWEAPRMEFKNVGAEVSKGYNWGAGLSDKLKNLFSTKDFTGLDQLDDIKDLLSQQNDLAKSLGNTPSAAGGSGSGGSGLNDIGKALSGGYGKNPALDKIAKGVGDIANNTSTLAKSEEDLTYMRDLAEREAINRYTMTDLKVEMNNNNNINSNMDLDTVVGYLQDKVYEGILSTAEGVHF